MKVRTGRTPLAVLRLLPLAIALLPGCASNSDALEKRLADLRNDIRKLQNDNDRVNERLEGVELRQARAETAARPSAQAAAGTVTRPRLKVLHLSPEGDSADEPSAPAPAATDAGGSHVILRGQGKDLELKNAGDSSSRAAPREKSVTVSQNEQPTPDGRDK